MKKYYFALVLTLFVLPFFGQNIPSYVPKDGLVGYWPFNGNANDESGNGNDGTVNLVTWGKDRFGKMNATAEFNSIYQRAIRVEQPKATFGNEISYSFWLKINTPLSYYNNIINVIGQCNLYGPHPSYQQAGLVGKLGYSGWLGYNNSDSLLNDGKWHHSMMVVNWKGGSVAIYIDGKLNAKHTFATQSLVQPTHFDFGQLYNVVNDPVQGPQNIFAGELDDIAIFNRSLTEQEIKQVYQGCNRELASSNNFNSLLFTTSNVVILSAEPQGGVFSGTSIENNQFIPSKAKIGRNKVQYTFKNSQGCKDSTQFTMIVADTVGASCTKYDTITVKNNIYDTVVFNKTKYDTVTVTNNVTKYDTVVINQTKYDTITVTNNVTKYDTVIVNKTKYDTITVTNNVTKYDTVLVNKYDTITVTDTVSILKINFKLTTGLQANQMASMSVYPNPTTDVLHIEIGDAKALDGYRYRILDALGKEVYNELVKNTLTEIQLKTLGASGMYQLEVLDGNKTSIQTNKIVLQ